MKISFSNPFSSKLADLAENVVREGPEKQAIISCSLTFSAKSAMLKAVENKTFFLVYDVQEGDIFHI